VLSERRRSAPCGAAGGGDGARGANWIVRRGRREAMPAKFAVDLAAGDRIGMRTPAGGGWGRARGRP
jgi:N-methylhydantoinase B/oxoprolinase/acetone carboxylase alpha subunit